MYGRLFFNKEPKSQNLFPVDRKRRSKAEIGATMKPQALETECHVQIPAAPPICYVAFSLYRTDILCTKL